LTISEILWEVRQHFFRGSYPHAKADWPHRLDADLPVEQVKALQDRVESLSAAAQYGWGHSIDFGPFRQDGFLEDQYLEIAGLFDKWNWWPRDMKGLRVADVGCFTGGLSVLMAGRGAEQVYAVDEVPEHLAQCAFLGETFGVDGIETIEASAFRLGERIEAGSLDIVLLSGVLYHMSDMLVGLLGLRELLKPGGLLLIETTGVEDNKRSFANFGRYCGGMWWQPSGLCIKDMCEYMGFDGAEVSFYKPHRCLARAVKNDDADIPFKRGMNWEFDSLRDRTSRSVDKQVLAPVRHRLF
jgi:SAM-dependent methyltransferase